MGIRFALDVIQNWNQTLTWMGKRSFYIESNWFVWNVNHHFFCLFYDMREKYLRLFRHHFFCVGVNLTRTGKCTRGLDFLQVSCM